MKNLLIALFTTAIMLLTGCGSTRPGKVGVEYTATTPVGQIGASAGINWGVEAPDNTYLGEIIWLGPDGKPLEGAPRGQLVNGHGGGVVPAGATGWQGATTPAPPPPANISPIPIPILVFGQFQGCSVPGINVPGNNRVYDYILLVHASTFDQARSLANQVLDDRHLPLPSGVDIIHMVDLQMVDSGFIGEFVNDLPTSSLEVFVNGEKDVTVSGSVPLTNGYCIYPMGVSKKLLVLPTVWSISNTLRTRSTDTSGVRDHQVLFTWRPK